MNETNPAKNVLTSDVEIKGTLKFSGELTFDGKLEGEIQTDGVLNLGDSAVINGNISAQSVIVRGKVTGNIHAKEKIEIKGKTEVNPNKVAPTASPRPAEAPKTPEAARPPLR